VSIQAQVVNLLEELQEELGLAYLFIAHDLSVVRHMADRVGVMYLGRIVEMAPSEDLYQSPQHPYTQALLSAIPIPDPQRERERKRIALSGDVPAPDREYAGCSFADRCPVVEDRCRQAPVPLEGVGRQVACVKVGQAKPPPG
jgi:oligopeptide transport system ATP-binding protein